MTCIHSLRAENLVLNSCSPADDPSTPFVIVAASAPKNTPVQLTAAIPIDNPY